MTGPDQTAPIVPGPSNALDPVESTRMLVERIFGAVTTLRDQLSARTGPAGGRESPHRQERQLQAEVAELLSANRDIMVGMGLITASGVPQGSLPLRHRLQWWQYVPGRAQPTALRVDLNPDSIGFYDCDAAEWFRVPRVSGQRHIVGPYVDAHGTDRYLLTFTVPLVAGTEFLGVVGADVAVSVFETRLLAAWGRQQHAVMIVNQQRRVVVSNAARAVCGDLLHENPAAEILERTDLPGAPWQVLVARRGSDRAPQPR